MLILAQTTSRKTKTNRKLIYLRTFSWAWFTLRFCEFSLACYTSNHNSDGNGDVAKQRTQKAEQWLSTSVLKLCTFLCTFPSSARSPTFSWSDNGNLDGILSIDLKLNAEHLSHVEVEAWRCKRQLTYPVIREILTKNIRSLLNRSLPRRCFPGC